MEVALEKIRILTSEHNIDAEKIFIHPDSYPDGSEEKLDAAKRHGVVIMGIPVGSESYIQAHLFSVIIPEIERVVQRIIERCDCPQLSHCFLKLVVNAKPMHILRSLYPRLVVNFCDKLDSIQRGFLATIAGVLKIPEINYAIAKSKGGLGLPDFCDIPDAAFTASVVCCRAAIEKHLPGALQLDIPLTAALKLAVESLNASGMPHSLQTLLDVPTNKHKGLQADLMEWRNVVRTDRVRSLVTESLPSALQAMYSSSSTSEAGLPFSVVPKSPGLSMEKGVFQAALRSKIALCHASLITHGTQCDCNRHTTVDDNGIHLVKCRSDWQLTIAAHNKLRDTVLHMLRNLGFAAQPEILLRDLGLVPCTDDSTMDIVVNESGVPSSLLDVRITSPVSAEAERGEVALNKKLRNRATTAEKDKVRRYGAIAAQGNVNFYPLIIESSGAWGDKFTAWFLHLFIDYAKKTGQNVSNLQNYWKSRIATCVQVGVQNKVIKRAFNLRSRAGVVLSKSEDEASLPGVVAEYNVVDNHNGW